MKKVLNCNSKPLKLIFARKVCNMDELKNDIAYCIAHEKPVYETAHIVAEREMPFSEWNEFINNLLDSREWLAEFTSMVEKMGYCGYNHPCIKVWARGCKNAIVIQTEGYDYPRYVSIIPA